MLDETLVRRADARVDAIECPDITDKSGHKSSYDICAKLNVGTMPHEVSVQQRYRRELYSLLLQRCPAVFNKICQDWIHA